MKKHITYLEKIKACSEAIEWAQQFETMQEAWDNCEQGDWMLWLLGKQVNNLQSRKKLVLTACTCARLSLKYIPKNEKRPLKAIKTAEKWANGDKTVSLATVANVANVANVYAAYSNVTVNVAYATYAASYAAEIVNATYIAYAATTVAVYVADATAYTADATAFAVNAHVKALKKCADIVRKDYPKIRMI